MWRRRKTNNILTFKWEMWKHLAIPEDDCVIRSLQIMHTKITLGIARDTNPTLLLGGVGWRRALQKGDYILIFVWWPQCNNVYIYETLTMMSVCLRYCHGYWAIFFCCNILCNLICWSPRRWPWEQNEMPILTGIFRSKLEHALRTQPVFLCKLNNTSYVS